KVIDPDAPVHIESSAQSEEDLVENKADLIEIFQDDFEEELWKWRVKRYSGYNDFMKWHLSGKEYVSGKRGLTLGHQDTNRKENYDTVHIETKEDFFLTEESVLSFKIKKEYQINLEIVLKKEWDGNKETVVTFYPGNSMYKEWREEEIPLGLYIDKGEYTLMLRAWDQGSLYIDDIKIQK
ncbi:MAG: hypothetical protein D3922_12990, partial [Candidatus Electrothrix sp. AR1]|nr:hypothetical protein [Candidatus Electrothrix sp. AR1]